MPAAGLIALGLLSLGVAGYAIASYSFLPLGALLHPDMRLRPRQPGRDRGLADSA
jgi:hypothetical protein